ncbi:MAG: helicase C-terminal domain-containing protein [Thermodesulfovibrionales bacterium]
MIAGHCDTGRFFGDEGILSRVLNGYEPRTEQLRMSEAIADALSNKKHLIVEAGTGVGKSLAYLIPIVEWVLDSNDSGDSGRRRAVVSTYTKALQGQLVEKDLPFLRDNVFRELKFALCLGSENYLCLRRLDQAKTHGLFDLDEAEEINRLLRWVKRTSTGTRSEINVPHQTWQKVCRESDLCYGKECKKFDSCFYQKAKAIERGAHILVTNHHLFFANVVSGWNVLPPFDSVVFDEAHELEDVASDYLGVEVSNFKLRHLFDSILSPQGKGLLLRLKWLSQTTFSEISAPVNIARMRGDAFLNELSERLKDSTTLRIHEKGFIKDDLSEALISLRDSLNMLEESSCDEDEKKEITALALRSEALALSLRSILEQEFEGHVYWAERDGRRLRLVATPVEIASILKTQVFDVVSSAILTSATLATNNPSSPPFSKGRIGGFPEGSFDYIKERLGLFDAETLLLHSPFEYKKQALLYIPDDIKEPGTEGFEEALINRIREILEVTMGRTLVLFTSYSLLTRAYSEIKIPRLKVLKQGDGDSYRLVQEFRKNRNSVIFGTYTFWQGIDIPGDDLQCVVITKLPFSVPDEPVTEARMEALSENGKNPFYHYQVPQAVILLKQGFGRLIRTKTDRGTVAIMDTRVRTKGYGAQFLKSLPECKTTSSIDDIRGFLHVPAKT